MKRLVVFSLTLILGAIFPSLGLADAEGRGDAILIRGGTVIDGTGAPGRVTDVLILDDRIAEVAVIEMEEEDLEGEESEFGLVIDASGMVVTPGFIDTHSHGNPLGDPALENFLAMGVTTITLGQDGSSPDREDLATWMTEVEAAQPGVNIALFVGHATVRGLSGAGLNPDPASQEVARMAALVADAMDAGCWGLSTGLEYDGGRPADLDELIAVATPVGERGGVVMSHLRTEDDDVIEGAIGELVAQCRGAGSAAHISHLKIVYGHGVERAEEILALMETARSIGLRVTADVYPYTASYTGIGIVFPEWAKPPNDYDEVVAARRDELAAYLRERITLRNGPEATLFGTEPWTGRTLAEVAEELEKPFEDVLIDDIPPGSASAAYFVMDAEVMERLLVDPNVMVCSDGSVTSNHPRGHGTFARIIREFVVERGLLTLEEAVRKMTSLSAETLGISDRGVIAEGRVADLLIFDPNQVRDTATFEEPHQLAEGFQWVIVNGEVVRAEGEFTGARPGRVLRSSGAAR